MSSPCLQSGTGRDRTGRTGRDRTQQQRYVSPALFDPLGDVGAGGGWGGGGSEGGREVNTRKPHPTITNIFFINDVL